MEHIIWQSERVFKCRGIRILGDIYNEIYISINMYTIILQQWNNSMIEKYKMCMWDIFGG